MKRFFLPLVFFASTLGLLVYLGTWQLNRLAWKTAVLAEIDAKLLGAPVAVPAQPSFATDQFLPVTATGAIGPDEIHILASVKKIGAGYRIISRFDLGDRAVLLDRGFVALTAKTAPRPMTQATITGNLHWPDEMNASTPNPDIAKNIWFGRDIAAMAKALRTDPVLIVQRGSSEENLVTTPFPVTSEGIPNKHLEYVMTWYGLAIVWTIMSGYFLWKRRNYKK
ncbi:MAG: SURF1 family protein [Halocynthiibacter sp.]